MPRVSEISILHQLATSRKRSAEEIMGWGEGRTGSASSRGSEWFLVAVAVLCFWLSLVLYNVS